MPQPKQITVYEIDLYRSVFLGSENGKLVLKHFLCRNYGFSNNLTTEEERIRHNVCLELLTYLGVMDPNRANLVDAIAAMPIQFETPESSKETEQ